jgi:hypothetical protein
MSSGNGQKVGRGNFLVGFGLSTYRSGRLKSLAQAKKTALPDLPLSLVSNFLHPARNLTSFVWEGSAKTKLSNDTNLTVACKVIIK